MSEIYITKYLRYLIESGWTEIIDSRYKNTIIKELQQKFPDITSKELDEVLSVVIY